MSIVVFIFIMFICTVKFKIKSIMKKVLHTLLTISFLLVITAQAQQVTLEWVLNPLDSAILGGTIVGRSNAMDTEGNIYITGYFQNTANFNPAGTANLTSAGSNDIFLAKYDASGNYVWAKSMGGTGSDIGNSVALDASGNAYITGHFAGTANFNPSGTANLISAGGEDIFLAKYDASGNYLWANQMGGTGNDVALSVALDAIGNAYITGYFQGTANFNPAGTANLTSAGGNDIFLAKYDASGNYVWANRMGGTGNDVGHSVALDASGNAYITGSFNGTANFNPSGTANLTSAGSNDIFLAKYDASGNYVWANRMGGTNADTGYSVALDASGNAYITGFFSGTANFNPAGTANLTSAGGADIFLAKYDASGNYVWAKRMGGTGDDRGFSVALDASGNAYITGYFAGTANFNPSGTANLTSAGGADIFLAKYDASGNYVWAKRMGGTGGDIGNSVALDPSGNAYITGYFNGTANFNPSGTANLVAGGTALNAFNAKYSDAGDYVFAYALGGYSNITFNQQANAVAVDGDGNSYITGYFTGTVDFDPSANTANLTSAGGSDIFLAKYDASGNYVWAKSMGGTIGDIGRSLALDALGNAYIAGSFQGTANFNPAGTANLTSAGSNDIFLAKYDALGNYVWAKSMGGTGSDEGSSVALDASGNAYITGFFAGTVNFNPAGSANLTSAGGEDIFLAKYDASGIYVWANRMGGTGGDIGLSVTLDASSNAYITGNFAGTANFDPAGTANLTSAGGQDVFLAKYDASGIYVWTKRMGGNGFDVGYSVALDASSNAYITGQFEGTANFNPSGTANLTSAGGFDIFLAKYDALGNYVWAKSMGGTGGEAGNSVTLDASGNAYITGYFNGTANFNPAGTANLVSAGGLDIFLAKYDASGNYVWANRMGGTGNDRGVSAALDASGNAYITGYFAGTANFNPEGITNITSLNGQDIFLAKYRECFTTFATDIITACDSYMWIDGVTYTISNNTATHTLTNAAGCDSLVTLNLTITNSTINTTTASSCDTYTWSENGQTYTASGTYTVVAGCHTEELVLTITNSTINTTTASSCDSYTWLENGQTYTASGTYTVVTGCHTEELVLTITNSTTNTTTASSCDSYTWSENGQTYTASGTYTVVTGCHTEELVLTITNSTTNTTTASSCDSYTWSENGQTYTASGIYTVVTGCHTEEMVLTITNSTTNTTTASSCDSYTWSENGQTYTASGTYTVVTGCHTEELVLTITNSTTNTTTVSSCDSYTWSENGQTYTTSGTYTVVTGCHTEELVLTITNSTTNTTTASSCD